MQLILDHVLSRVTLNMNNILIRPFILDEVPQVVKDMNPDKSLGLDGLSAMFYQNYCSIIGDSMIAIVLDFLNGVAYLASINSTLIVLIPKVSSLENVGDFLPCSLCNVLYKVAFKLIVNHFKYVLLLFLNFKVCLSLINL